MGTAAIEGVDKIASALGRSRRSECEVMLDRRAPSHRLQAIRGASNLSNASNLNKQVFCGKEFPISLAKYIGCAVQSPGIACCSADGPAAVQPERRSSRKLSGHFQSAEVLQHRLAVGLRLTVGQQRCRLTEWQSHQPHLHDRFLNSYLAERARYLSVESRLKEALRFGALRGSGDSQQAPARRSAE
jgi:hypothetical protein